MRLVQEVALYGDNTLAKKLTSLDTQLSVTKGEIDAIISSSELTELRNGSSTMYSLLNSVKSDVSGTRQQLSEVLTKYDATSRQYTEMSTKLNQLSTSVNGNTASVSELKTSLGQTDQRVSTVTQTASGLTSTVSAIRSSLANDYSTTTQVSSMISQSADAIRLKADKIAWTSKYSSMTEDGKLTCQAGTFYGDLVQQTGSQIMKVTGGSLSIYYSGAWKGGVTPLTYRSKYDSRVYRGMGITIAKDDSFFGIGRSNSSNSSDPDFSGTLLFGFIDDKYGIFPGASSGLHNMGITGPKVFFNVPVEVEPGSMISGMSGFRFQNGTKISESGGRTTSWTLSTWDQLHGTDGLKNKSESSVMMLETATTSIQGPILTYEGGGYVEGMSTSVTLAAPPFYNKYQQKESAKGTIIMSFRNGLLVGVRRGANYA